MNPFRLDATGLMVWGLVVHLIADWPLQNDWMATNKSKRAREVRKHVRMRLRLPRRRVARLEGDLVWPGTYVAYLLWRHPAAYVHAGIHALLLAPVFGIVAAPLAIAHLLIDTRTPVVWWSRLVRQTQPSGDGYDVGLEVRFWTDQVFHIATLAVAALAITAA